MYLRQGNLQMQILALALGPCHGTTWLSDSSEALEPGPLCPAPAGLGTVGYL